MRLDDSIRELDTRSGLFVCHLDRVLVPQAPDDPWGSAQKWGQPRTYPTVKCDSRTRLRREATILSQ